MGGIDRTPKRVYDARAAVERAHGENVLGMFWGKFKHILLGKTLTNSELEGEKLGRFWGVPIMASDAVSSVAHAVEEMLLVLVPALGLAASGYLGTVTLPIILLFWC